MIARRAEATGRVQGVGFRWSTRDRARALGVVGWVRNTATGSVEVHVEGSADAVEAMCEWLGEGPAAARVDTLSMVEAAPEGAVSFEITG